MRSSITPKETANIRNFCGNGFPDWLEVNLTSKCNGTCAWCVDKRGWHPRHVATWQEIADAAIATGRKNIILLGGEPTLHANFGDIVKRIRDAGLFPWCTTNGSRLYKAWIVFNMIGIRGVNVSIHHYDLSRNKDITGIGLNEGAISEAINFLHDTGATVRFNCNCIAGEIDSADRIRAYLRWSKEMGADKVRMAELKHDDDSFVDLAEVLEHKYGLNDNPFRDGCNSDAIIEGMPVNFRQMCGMQTRLRPCPKNPQLRAHPVLYYDGKFYNGWQQQEDTMSHEELLALLEKVKLGEMSINDAAMDIGQERVGRFAGSMELKLEKMQKQLDSLNGQVGGGSCAY